MIAPPAFVRISLARSLAIALVVVGGVALTAWSVLQRPPGRPKYIFVNETESHQHDLALQMTIKLAEKKSGIENALVLLPKLPPGVTIESEAAALFQKWRIGETRQGQGILYLYSKAENQFRIEVSYPLEGIFPDAECRKLEEAARTYMLSEISQDFLSELMITMNEKGKSSAGESMASPAWFSARFLSGGGGVSASGYANTLAAFKRAIAKLPVGESVEYGAAPEATETLARYLRSMENGIGDPQLPLLTEGSQIFRWVVPRNRAQQRRAYEYYQKALPHRVALHGDWGLAVFKAGVPNLPIVLRRGSDNLWYVDEPKAWTWFHRFEDNVDFFPKYQSNPVQSNLLELGHPHAQRAIFRDRLSVGKVPTYPFSLVATVGELEAKIAQAPHDASLYAQLGALYLFEANWIGKALAFFELAAKKDPKNREYRWRLWDLYLNSSRMEDALRELAFLAKELPNDREVQEWHSFYQREYRSLQKEF